MATANSVKTEVEFVLEYLQTKGLSFFWNEMKIDNNSLTWKRKNPSIPLYRASTPDSFRQYLAWLENSDYSAVLFDGSLIQITYRFARNRPIFHRLAYIPCPVEIDLFDFPPGDMALSDYIDLHFDFSNDYLLRSSFRFDFDNQVVVNHPKSHVTLNSVDCRIPCAGPLRANRFFCFLFSNFYPDKFKDHPAFFADLAQNDSWARHVISEDDKLKMHICWPH